MVVEDEDSDGEDCGDYERLEDNPDLIDQYLTAVGASEDDAIRIVYDEYVIGSESEYEIIIPPSLLNGNGGGLSITTTCVAEAQKDTLPQSEVDLEAWPWDNALGSWETWDPDLD